MSLTVTSTQPSRARHVMATKIGYPIATSHGNPGVLWVGTEINCR